MSIQEQVGRGSGDVPGRPSTGMTVLHLDDDPGFPTMLAEFAQLEGEAIYVVSATDAVEALDRLESDDVDFDCIVTDCEMPGMDGLEFAREVRRRGIDLPLIMFSTSALDTGRAETVESPGITAWIQKGGAEQYRELIHLLGRAAGIAGWRAPLCESADPAPSPHRTPTRWPVRAFKRPEHYDPTTDDQLPTAHHPRIECKRGDRG